MKIEHVAFHVDDPVAVARWWVKALGFKVTFSGPKPGDCRFIVDKTGLVAIELYKVFDEKGREKKAPNYFRRSASAMHFAFVSEDVEKDSKRLIKKGATYDKKAKPIFNDDMQMIMLRDPFGFAFQLIKRKKSVLIG